MVLKYEPPLGSDVLRERARHHFQQLGWSVEESPALRQGAFVFRPDLLARRGEDTQAVRVDDETLGAYPIGVFAAACKKFRVNGVVICPPSEAVVEACRERGIDYLSSEGLGEVWFPSGPPPTPEPLDAPPARGVSFGSAPAGSASVPAWRWIVVAVVWLAALYFVVRFVLDVVGG